MDLDTLAWLPTDPPERMPLQASRAKIEAFINANKSWVIEGCYTDLLNIAGSTTTDIIFLDIGLEQCIQNARERAWEPHKYDSKAAQDANLEMLIDWIKAYDKREDNFSSKAHEAFFQSFTGKKKRITKMCKD